ncbi:hypothetical protein OG21DRAFT_1516739 [Imleria badia]|nr:hypothetical protein OG21DRAFT_1516739 [Imleria badia]
MFHALNDEPVPSRLAEPYFAASTSAVSSSEPTATASVSGEPVSTANATASPTTTTATPSVAGGSTSGASHHLGGGVHAALVLSAAVSVVFFAC